MLSAAAFKIFTLLFLFCTVFFLVTSAPPCYRNQFRDVISSDANKDELKVWDSWLYLDQYYTFHIINHLDQNFQYYKPIVILEKDNSLPESTTALHKFKTFSSNKSQSPSGEKKIAYVKRGLSEDKKDTRNKTISFDDGRKSFNKTLFKNVKSIIFVESQMRTVAQIATENLTQTQSSSLFKDNENPEELNVQEKYYGSNRTINYTNTILNKEIYQSVLERKTLAKRQILLNTNATKLTTSHIPLAQVTTHSVAMVGLTTSVSMMELFGTETVTVTSVQQAVVKDEKLGTEEAHLETTSAKTQRPKIRSHGNVESKLDSNIQAYKKHRYETKEEGMENEENEKMKVQRTNEIKMSKSESGSSKEMFSKEENVDEDDHREPQLYSKTLLKYRELFKGDLPLHEKSTKVNIFHDEIALQGVSMKLFKCIGSIVSKSWILTSADCFFRNNNYEVQFSSYSILAGVTEIADVTPYYPGEWRSIASVEYHTHVHDYYDKGERDLALVKVNEPYVVEIWTKLYITPVINEPLTEFTHQCSMEAWGYNMELQLKSYRRIKYLVTADEYKSCDADFERYIPPFLICVKTLQEWSKCREDLGTPLFCNRKLYGVKVGGLSCGDENAPSLYVDVGYHQNWINSTITRDTNTSTNSCMRVEGNRSYYVVLSIFGGYSVFKRTL